MNKNADLSLSVNTIVIIILAITLLGLGLTFINSIASGAFTKLGNLIETTDLDKKPTSADPLTISEAVEVQFKKQEDIKVGFYNKGPSTVSDIKPVITSCISISEETEVDEALLPSLVAPAKASLEPGETQGFLATLKEKGLSAGRYTCTLTMEGDFGEGNAPTKDFYLNIIS